MSIGVHAGGAEAAPSAGVEPASGVADLLRDATIGVLEPSERLERFLGEESPWRALELWLGLARISVRSLDKARLLQALNSDVSRIDALLSDQVNAVLHHRDFQKLEASWRGLRYLVDETDSADGVKVRVLDVSWQLLCRDLDRAIEFDQSQLFKKVYSDELDTPGGEPFGLLIGDYEIRPRPVAGNPTDDVAALTAISHVAAASFAPFVASASPAMLGLGGFEELELTTDLSTTFRAAEYTRWNSFRDSEDSRFVALTLPRVLMRTPYEDGDGRVDGFRFREDVAAPGHERYLWGNPAYAFATVVTRAFAASGWLADIRGAPRDRLGGGLVTGLSTDSFHTDRPGLAPKSSTEVMIPDSRDKEISELGLIPLSHCSDTEVAAFHSNRSVQRPKKYDELAATMNARLSTMLQYMLCVSRFGHYVKVICRDKVGSFVTPEECESHLRGWILGYSTASDDGTIEHKAKYPLREADVQVRERPGRPGNYMCTVHLRPHFQLDQMVSGVKLVTDVAASRAA